MSKKKEKSSKKKVKYDRVQLDSQEVFNGLTSFLNILDANGMAIDEITIHITSEKTGKSKKIHLFKDFKKFAKKYMKKHNVSENEYYSKLAEENKNIEFNDEFDNIDTTTFD